MDVGCLVRNQVCHCPNFINLSQHLIGVHGTAGQERKRLVQREMNVSEVMISEPLLTSSESHTARQLS